MRTTDLIQKNLLLVTVPAAHLGNGTLHERDKGVISQGVPPGLSRPTGIEHMLNAPTFPAHRPQGAFLCVLLPGFTDHPWSLNSSCCLHWEDKKKRLWGPAHFKNRRAKKKKLLRYSSLCRSLKLYPGITYTMRVEEG